MTMIATTAPFVLDVPLRNDRTGHPKTVSPRIPAVKAEDRRLASVPE